MKRAILILPEFANPSSIVRLRRRFDPLAEAIPAHITLAFPFKSDLTEAQLEAHLRQALQGVEPFEVMLGGITGQAEEYLFLNVKRGNDALIELHDRLYTGPLAGYLASDITYCPHLTVGRLPSKSEFWQALEAARGETAMFQAVMHQVCIFRIESEGAIWEEMRVSIGQ